MTIWQYGSGATDIVTLATPPPIVGRQHELLLLKHEYERVKYGYTRVAFLSGEPGIGKTRLLDEFAELAIQDRAVVLRGGASKAEGMPPYLPFLEALGHYIQITPPTQLREQVAFAPQVLASILPELTTRLGDLPASYAMPSEQGRFRLYEAIKAFLQAISTPHALVLVLDDLQWADSASLDLLCHVVRSQSIANLLILGAYRDNEIGQSDALTRTLAELTRQRVLTAITVDPLTAGEIETLAVNATSCPLSKEVGQLLHRQSEGNPFFAEEILRGWIEAGALVQKNNRLVAATSLDRALPPSIIGALWQRFARLSSHVIDHLRVAAIIGRTFDILLLATVEGQEVETIEGHLLEAVHAHLIRADQMESFMFSHDKIRECLYAEVSTYRRRHLHGIIGNALETRCEREGIKSAYQLAELAFHFARSGDRARGISYTLDAAIQALQTSALEEAIAYYHTALELIGPDDKQYENLLYSLREVALLPGKGGDDATNLLLLISQGKWIEAERIIEQGQVLADAMNFHHLSRGFLAFQREEYTTAEHELQVAIAKQNPQSGLGVIMFSSCLLSLVQVALEKCEQARACMARLERLLDKFSDGTLLTAPIIVCLALIAVALHDQERAIHLYSRLLAFQGRYTWFLVDRVLGMVATLNDDTKAATMHFTAAEALARQENLLPELARTLLVHAEVKIREGDQENLMWAGALLNEASTLFEELGMSRSAHIVCEQLRTFSPRADYSPISTLPGHLSQREVAVLKLVSSGQSNRQIAQALGISEKTVTNHLTHIFNKTISENRAAATAFAVRHGLA